MFMHDTASFSAATRVLPVTGFARPVRSGLAAGTRIETASGWRAVETLARGDLVHTLDGGLRPLVRVDRDWIMPGAGARPVMVTGGLFGTCADLLLLEGQCLALETGNPRPEHAIALIPAGALRGLPGIRPVELREPLQIVTPVFADEEVVFANTGVRLLCPGADPAAPAWFARLDDGPARTLAAQAA
ncbi:MAG: Hint domain-containing protein [Gemmobacter sp.]